MYELRKQSIRVMDNHKRTSKGGLRLPRFLTAASKYARIYKPYFPIIIEKMANTYSRTKREKHAGVEV